jgi:hypothetical protein
MTTRETTIYGIGILTCIDLQAAGQNFQTVKYAQLSMEFCNRNEHTYWVNLTDCMKITPFIDRQIKEVDDLKLLSCRCGKYGELLIMPTDGKWDLIRSLKG